MKDVIVVGAGLTGMLLTRMLHDAGQKVMLIDQGELGHESSWTSSGIVPPLYPWQLSEAANRLISQSHQQLSGLCQTLYEETRIDPQLLNSGLLLLDTALTPTIDQWARQNRQQVEVVDEATISKKCPGLCTQQQPALFLPDVQQVRNPSLVQALAASLRQRPILISEHRPVTGLKIDHNRVTGVQLGDEIFTADKVVITAGAWSPQFSELTALLPAIDIVRKEMILLRGRRGVLSRIVVRGDHYLVPRRDGRIICGATRTIGSYDKTPDELTRDQLRRFANQLMPYCADIPLRNHWVGTHAVAREGVPCSGEHPEISGLYFNAGNGSSTMSTDLASTQALAQLMLA